MAKGAMRQGKKKFPAIDLFRLVQVSYKPNRRGELQNARQVELVRDFDRLALVPNHFRTAIWLSRFATKKSVQEDPAPQLFEAMRCAYARLSGPRLDSCVPIWLGVVFSALDEHGLLPDLSHDASRQEGMHAMLAYATDHELPPPQYTDSVWLALAEWAHDYMEQAELNTPDGLEEIL